MRKTLFLLGCCIVLALECFGQPKISNVSYSKNADIYSLFEITLDLDPYSNPYDPAVIDLYAEFIGPNRQVRKVNGFYFESYGFQQQQRLEQASRNDRGDGWKIRFTPDVVGTWRFVIHAVDQNGATTLSTDGSTPFTMQCRAVDQAKGFISRANTMYLQREIYAEGATRHTSFFPVGPNVAWYECADYYVYQKPYGIYEYERYIDQLAGNANYMRVWLTRYQYLSLYGPEHTIREAGRPKMYFDATLNQKDAAELDQIVANAAEHDIALMLCFFTYGDFRDDSEALDKSQKYGSMPSGWRYNPFHTVLGLQQPMEFFTDARAKRITKNLIRYIVARWGYATNVMAWELWNEIGNIFKPNPLDEANAMNLANWHAEMANYIRANDPYGHLITTSKGSSTVLGDYAPRLYDHLDLMQDHLYQHIQKSKSAEQMSYSLLKKSLNARLEQAEMPYFMGEYGLNSPTAGQDYDHKDPKGIDMHNSLWSSLFSGSMGPASFWYWSHLSRKNLFERFKPLTVFCKNLPILSDSFSAKITGSVSKGTLEFPNNLATYYLINATEDTLYGWSQDTAFCYQSLRRLTDPLGNNGHFADQGTVDSTGYVYTLDPAKRPKPSSRRNTIIIPVPNQPTRTKYAIRWFDAETGKELVEEATTAVVRRRLFSGKSLSIQFPSSIRDTKNSMINNTFGDAVFVIYKLND